MDLQLKNKIALVSGSTAGIGLAVAQLLSLEGATVIVNGRTETRVSEAVTKIKAINAKLIPVAADLSEKHGIEKMIKTVPNGNQCHRQFRTTRPYSY